MDDFRKYYERELTFTRGMMAEFARKYPKIAARLQLEPDKCEDPQMERLIEAFAFECARLHMKIDDHFPEIVEPLLNLVFPHFIRPIPSMSVVRFEPTMTTIPPSAYPMDKKIALFAKTNEAVCRFTTVYPVTLWPAEVVSAELREPGKLVKDAKQAVVIKLKTHNGLGPDQIDWKNVGFFINGQDRRAFGTYELLLNNTCHVEYVARNRDGKTEAASMPPDCIRPVGFEPDEAMLPSLRKEFPGFLLLFEYFCFPEKFLFIDFNGFDKFRPKDADSLEIRIYIPKFMYLIPTLNQGLNKLRQTLAVPKSNIFRLNQKHDKLFRLLPEIFLGWLLPGAKKGAAKLEVITETTRELLNTTQPQL